MSQVPSYLSHIYAFSGLFVGLKIYKLGDFRMQSLLSVQMKFREIPRRSAYKQVQRIPFQWLPSSDLCNLHGHSNWAQDTWEGKYFTPSQTCQEHCSLGSLPDISTDTQIWYTSYQLLPAFPHMEILSGINLGKKGVADDQSPSWNPGYWQSHFFFYIRSQS